MTKQIQSLNGKVAIVTGAGHPEGIGRACARKLAAYGAKVVISDLTENDDLQSFEAECANLGTQGLSLVCDVTRAQQTDETVRETIQKFGQVDILVNNAGVGVGQPDFLQTSDKDWDISLNVNLRGVVNMCKAAIPHLQNQGSGSIVNIASLSGLGAIAGIPACYTASKFAVVGLTKQLALELAPKNIRCNAVCPGSVRTQMMKIAMENLAEFEGITVEEAEGLEAGTIPLGRAADPDEIAEFVALLASDAGRYMTGVALPVAGGMASGL